MSDAASDAGSPARRREEDPPTPERLSSPPPLAEDGGDDGGNGGDEEAAGAPKAHGSDDDGDESDAILSDVDEDQFEDYDPATAYIEERPIAIDEEAARGLKATKRKRGDGADKDGGAAALPPRHAKEGRREKKRRRPAAGEGEAGGAAGANEDDEAADGAADGDGARAAGVKERAAARRSRATAEDRGEPSSSSATAPRRAARNKSASPEVNEEDLTPEERRKRALDRAINLAIRNPNKRRRKQDEDDLEKMADEEIAQLKIRMEQACMADIDARADGRPAVNKLQLLPQVLSVLNRNDIQETILDPETNFLQSVKFFLEPLNDGSLPSYTIQRDIFTCLTQLPIEKDALLSSGIGKVVLFYTRSKRAEPAIKRMAERLVGEWSRPILKKTDDFKKRFVPTADYDQRTARADKSQYTLTERPLSRFEMDKELQLAPPVVNPNRAQPVGLPQSYSIAPKSTFEGHRGADYRPIGASSIEAFRRMTQKAKMRNKKK